MNNYFCVLPFFGYEFNSKGSTHCCLLPKNYDINQIRADILNQKRSPFCSACWKLEDAGLISDRKLKNSALDFYWDKDIGYIEEEVKQGKYKTLLVKNYTSNICNSTCVTCNSGSSSAWAPLEKKMNIIPARTTQMTIDQINNNIDFKDIIGINFVGGEPLYEKLNFYILEKLIEQNNKKCFVSITTNGSVDLSSNQKALLSQFTNLNFNISIDGIGPVFEYMRYPLQWHKLLENLDFFKTITNTVSVSYTTSNLNVLYHHKTLDWFKKENLNYHFNPVVNPKHFRPNALPQKIKQQIFDRFGRSKDLDFFIGSEHTDKDDQDFAKLLEVISRQDKIKNIKLKDYMPEMWDLMVSFQTS